jgi:hypothetical protein
VSGDDLRHERARREIDRLASAWPDEYRLGYRFGFLKRADPPCDRAGYPLGLHSWPLDRRNAWWAGWNVGRVERDRRAASNTLPNTDAVR